MHRSEYFKTPIKPSLIKRVVLNKVCLCKKYIFQLITRKIHFKICESVYVLHIRSSITNLHNQLTLCLKYPKIHMFASDKKLSVKLHSPTGLDPLQRKEQTEANSSTPYQLVAIIHHFPVCQPPIKRTRRRKTPTALRLLPSVTLLLRPGGMVSRQN